MEEREQTWKDLVVDALAAIGGEGHLRDISAHIEGHPKTETNPTWRDTIRRVVRQYAVFEPVPPDRSGVYRLVPLSVPEPEPVVLPGSSPEVDHAMAQGMLVTLGSIYGYETFVPKTDQTIRSYGGGTLANVVSVRDCDEVLQSANIARIREIDVMWFAEDEDGLYPVCAFEVEHTTRVKEGLDRLLKIPARYASKLFVVGPGAATEALFANLLRTEPFRTHSGRFAFRSYEQLQSVHNAAVDHRKARDSFGVAERWHLRR